MMAVQHFQPGLVVILFKVMMDMFTINILQHKACPSAIGSLDKH